MSRWLTRRAVWCLTAIALLGLATAAMADTAANLAQSKQALKAIQQRVTPRVNRLPYERRREIWSAYYELLEQAWRMQVHYEMMTRHDRDRRVEFDTAHAGFERSLRNLSELLPADE